MTPGARAQAAIELLDAIEDSRGPADQNAQYYFRSRRFIGSKDRAAIAALVYAVLRHRAQLDWWIGRIAGGVGTSRARVIAALCVLQGWSVPQLADGFDGDRFRPATLSMRERELATALAGRSIEHPEQPPATRANMPAWLWPALEARFGRACADELAAMAGEAPLDLRANLLKGNRATAQRLLAAEGIDAKPTALAPSGLRVDGRHPLGATRAFKEGLIEIQDEGSQLAAALVDARPGMRVCDFCAGAGGKTLALAAAMQNSGKLVACDTVARRLEGAVTRLRRAGVSNVERKLLATERDVWVKRHKASFDRVLVDAPCTGTGTWRRNPDARWFLAESDRDELVAKQARILDSAARLVKPGGRLVYVTCSLLPDEDEEQTAHFLATHPDFARVPIAQVWQAVLGGACPVAGDELVLTPRRHETDGFFVSVMERASGVPDDSTGTGATETA
jgi:16S rRNA (cytosine967-C5)-methyltransferase